MKLTKLTAAHYDIEHMSAHDRHPTRTSACIVSDQCLRSCIETSFVVQPIKIKMHSMRECLAV